MSSPSPTPTPKPLSAFTRLSRQVRIFNPPSSSPPSPPNSPTTILLCSWMNASPKHISYYTKHYTALYPSAVILLTTITTKEFLLQSEGKRRKDILPAVTSLLSLTSPARGGNERILVHVLSNGGAKRLYGILSSYAQLSGHPLPITTLIFDSAPGIPQFKRDIHALSVPARRFPISQWALFMTVVYIITSVVYVAVHWCPRWVWYELVWGPMDGLRDEEVLGKGTVTGFVYSKEDMAIDWEDVEAYAEGMGAKGYAVERRRVEGAEHVQMFRGVGGERSYWGWIAQMWEKGLER